MDYDYCYMVNGRRHSTLRDAQDAADAAERAGAPVRFQLVPRPCNPPELDAGADLLRRFTRAVAEGDVIMGRAHPWGHLTPPMRRALRKSRPPGPFTTGRAARAHVQTVGEGYQQIAAWVMQQIETAT